MIRILTVRAILWFKRTYEVYARIMICGCLVSNQWLRLKTSHTAFTCVERIIIGEHAAVLIRYLTS
jgi:hypothetical protein